MEVDLQLRFLRHALQALAQPASVQKQLFPEFVCHGDELVIDFGDALDYLTPGTAATEEQRVALERLDSYIEEHSGETWIHLYRDANGLDDPVWEQARSLAAAALEAFGWPVEPPPGDRGRVYVQGNDVVKE